MILSERDNEGWTRTHGDVYRSTGIALRAVVDGKQRLTTATMWFESELAIPASWIRADFVAATEATDDGPYVRYRGLTVVGQRWFGNHADFAVAVFKATIEDEAAVYLLVNGGGTPQTTDDMQRARNVAGPRPA